MWQVGNLVGNLRRIGNPPGPGKKIVGPIANRPQVTNLPHKRNKEFSNRIVAMRVLLLMSLAGLSFAQTPPDQPQDKARIEGILVNKVNGQPLRKGTLSLRVIVTGPQP